MCETVDHLVRAMPKVTAIRQGEAKALNYKDKYDICANESNLNIFANLVRFLRDFAFLEARRTKRQFERPAEKRTAIDE